MEEYENICYRFLVRAVNSYPPAYPGCHGLRLLSIGLQLGGPQSHYVLYYVWYNTMYNTIIVLYPSLLAVGGVTRDMCACIVRQDYTGAHFHALGWTSPQRLFILRHLRRERNPKFKMTRQILQCSSLWNIFHPLHFTKKSAPSMCMFLITAFFWKRKHIATHIICI